MNRMVGVCAALIGLVALLCFLLSGCHGVDIDENAQITTFAYSHSGMTVDSIYSYTVEKNDNTGEITAVYEMNAGYETYSLHADAELLQALTAIVREHALARWDGFDKVHPHMLDGSGFDLHVRFDDGSGITASGSNRFPGGYAEAADAIDELFLGYLAEQGIDWGGGY